MKNITSNIRRGGGKTVSYLLAAFFAFAAAQSAWAAVIDMGGNTDSTTNLGSYKYNNTEIKNNELRNGTLNVTGNQAFADGTFTFGSGLTLNQTANQWGVSGGRTVKIVDGCVVNHMSGNDIYFGRYKDGSTWKSFNSNATQLILDNGVLNSDAELLFQPIANNNSKAKSHTINFVMTSGSALTLDASNGKELRIGQVTVGDSQKVTYLKLTAAITNSTITARQIRVGDKSNSTINQQANSFNNITFGPGTVLNVGQVYSYAYPAPTVVFDGVKLCWLAGNDRGDSLIGQNDGVTTRIYTIGPNGLVIDKSASTDSVRTSVSGMASALSGTGGITKTGDGTITWNTARVGGSTTNPMTFTGPLVVSNGTWSSTLGYAASAFRADGGTLVLSGALSAANVALAATEGGKLTLTGATITDASPDLTLAGGGTTDYFTRDSAVGTYALDSLTLGEGAVLDLDGNASAIDTINATTTNITATSANPAKINIKFSAAPAVGTTFTFFETDSADKLTVITKVGDVPLNNGVVVENGKLKIIIGDVYTWNGNQTNWGDSNAWTKGGNAATWSDGGIAFFDANGAQANLAADVVATNVSFQQNASIIGEGTLTVPSVSVAPSVSATISAPTAGPLKKTGAGTLTLGKVRTDQTVVSEGTLALTAGNDAITVANLTLGTDAAKPIALDYGGNTLSEKWTDYLTPGMDITLTNGTFSTTQNPGWTAATFPKTLTIAKGATMTTSERFTWNVSDTAGAYVTNYVNIAGGSLVSTKDNNNWIVQNSRSGTLKFDVSDGGLLELSGQTYILPCRDSTTENDTPSVLMTFNDSTFRVKNKHLFLGYDNESGKRKNPFEPIFELAMTNSTLNVGTGSIKLGHNVVQSNHGGHSTADFENCIITAKQFTVYYDRPANAARFNNSTIVLTADSDYSLEAQADLDAQPGEEWAGRTPITVGSGGLTVDTQNFDGAIQANLHGDGAVTKVGTGKLTIFYSQSSSAGLICEAGETLLNAGLTVARPVTVKNGATFTVAATAQSTLSSLALEAGSTLNIDSYTANLTPIQVTTALTLPVSGTVELKKNGGAFTKGLYPILVKTGITVADAVNLVPATSELSYEWMVQGDTLVLAVDMGTISEGFVWTGAAGDGKMSTVGNWLYGTAPSVAGTALDFSGMAVDTTIIGDIDVTFGAVTMGDGVITFTGDKMAVASFSDMEKVEVGANSTVAIDGDLMLTYVDGADHYAVYKVNDGGKFIVTGKLGLAAGSDCALRPQVSPGTGLVLAGSVVNDGTKNIYATLDNNSVTHKWVIGPGGITGTTESSGIWVNANNKVNPEFQPWTNDFTVTLWTVLRDTAKSWTYNTTGLDGLGHAITLDAGFSDKGPIFIAGTGKVVVNHVTQAFGGKSACSSSVTVKDTATLAINAGKKLTTGTITFAAGTTLEVPSTGVQMGEIAFSGAGTVTLKVAGDATLADGTYTLATSSSALPNNVLTKFSLDASAVKGTSDAWLEVGGDGKSIVLNIGDRSQAGAGIWVGGSGDFSTAANWKNGQVPVAGDPLDFSGVTSGITINCGDLSETAFGAVNLGTAKRQITINGTLRVASMTVAANDSNFTVASGSKLIVDGDVTLNSSSSAVLYIVYENYGEVEIGGKVIVSGSAKGYACYKCSESATIAAKGIECNNSSGDHFKFNAYEKNAPTVKWIVGEDGIGGSGSKSCWIDRGDGNNKHGTGAELKAAENFSIDKDIGARQILTLDTDDGKTITVNGEIYMAPAGTTVNTLTVKGSGTVICNYTQRTNGEHYTGDVVVTNTATLAINAGKKVTTGAITVNTNATLQVAQSGTVALGGNLKLNAGAQLGFNYTTGNEPKLNLTGKTVSFDEGETTNIVVKISADAGVRAKSGANVLTSGGKFVGVGVSLADGAPDWVKDVLVKDGEIVLDVKRTPLLILVR